MQDGTPEAPGPAIRVNVDAIRIGLAARAMQTQKEVFDLCEGILFLQDENSRLAKENAELKAKLSPVPAPAEGAA